MINFKNIFLMKKQRIFNKIKILDIYIFIHVRRWNVNIISNISL